MDYYFERRKVVRTTVNRLTRLFCSRRFRRNPHVGRKSKQFRLTVKVKSLLYDVLHTQGS